MTLEELREEARELGVVYSGLKKAELQKAIEEAKSEDEGEESVADETSEKVADETSEKVTDETSEKEDTEPEWNCVIVLNDSHNEIRRYTAEQHGKKFAEMAEQFSEKTGYALQYKVVEPGIKCPSCGHVIHVEK